MMILLPDRQDLSDWLRIATWRLSGPAKERIRTEIEAHYAQSVETHRENGLSESAAQAAALTELGDPEAAGKRFRKRHLTESEAEKLEKSDKRARSIWNLLGAYFVFCLFTAVALRLPFRRNILEYYHTFPLYFGAVFLVWLALPTACFLVARSSDVRPNRSLLLIYSLFDFAYGLFLCSFFIAFNSAPGMAPLYICLAIMYCGLPLGRLVILLRALIKLSKDRAKNLGEAS